LVSRLGLGWVSSQRRLRVRVLPMAPLARAFWWFRWVSGSPGAMLFIMVNQVLVRLWTRLRSQVWPVSGSFGIWLPATNGNYVQGRCGDLSVVMPMGPACVCWV